MEAIPIAAPQPAVVRAVYARGPLELEARLVAQVRAPVALRRALARAAGRMIAARGWERLGSARPSDHAVERAGISGRELRDLAAVDQPLAGLPILDAAFCAGEIGWTELRLLCRVATTEDQEAWLAPSHARALLRIERAARVCPPLREVFAEGRLSWVQAYALVPLLLEPATARYRGEWVAHAQRVSVRRLGDDVERALALGQFTPPPLEPGADQSDLALDPDADPAGLQTGAKTRLEKESERLVFNAHPQVAQLFRAVLATAQRRLERIRGHPCKQSDALEAMLDHALATWWPKRRIRRDYAVFERDGWRCTAPGCTSYRYLHRHHIVFRSHSGSNQQSNLTTCGRPARRSRSTVRGGVRVA